MTLAMLDVAGFANRLEQLERQNYRMKIALMALITLAGSIVLFGQAAPAQKILKAEVVEADRYVLRDTKGKQHVELEFKAFKGEKRISMRNVPATASPPMKL